MDTKACTITEEEVYTLIHHHMNAWDDDLDMRLERLNYLNKRLKVFREEEKAEDKPTIQPPPQPVAQTGW